MLNEFSLNLSKEVQQVCKVELLERYNLNYFQYLRCYNDGSIMLLSNQANWKKTYFDYLNKTDKPIIYSVMDEKIIQDHQFKFMWQNNIPDDILNLAKESHDITNGITFVERHKNYYDMIAFAAPASNHCIYELYLNKLDELERFIIRFRKEQNGLLEMAIKNKIFLPNNRQDTMKEKLINHKTSPSLSKRELEIIKLLKQGSCRKAIANQLGISIRTIEYYLENIKERLCVFSSNELISLIS